MNPSSLANLQVQLQEFMANLANYCHLVQILHNSSNIYTIYTKIKHTNNKDISQIHEQRCNHSTLWWIFLSLLLVTDVPKSLKLRVQKHTFLSHVSSQTEAALVARDSYNEYGGSTESNLLKIYQLIIPSHNITIGNQADQQF